MTPELIEEIKAEALVEFELLSRVYRPSYKTRKICDFLKEHIKELRPDIEVFEDQYRANLVDIANNAAESSGNLWFEVPANDPEQAKNEILILQAHMDMICASASEEAAKNMIQNGVQLEYHSNGTLTALNHQTSLGADNGIGIAFILAILKNNTFKHGPLRVIITTDEEVGMCGASYLGLTKQGDKGQPVQGCKYLLNVDVVSDGEIAVTSRGAVVSIYSIPKNPDTKPLPAGLNIFTLDIDGLLGGHDGIEIDKHASAVRVMAEVLKRINTTPDFHLIECISDTSEIQNVIQKHCYATFATSLDQNIIADAIESQRAIMAKTFPDERGVKFNLKPAELPPNAEIRPYSHDVATNIINLITALPFGPTSWKDRNIGWLETSGNMGPINLMIEKVEKDGKTTLCNPTFEMKSHVRSSNNDHLQEAIVNNKKLAKQFLGNDDLDYYQLKMVIYGWDENDDKSLLETVQKAYDKRDVTWRTSHRRGGLELSWFKYFNKELNMISIGPEIHDIHSCGETLYTGTLDNTIAVILTCIEKMKTVSMK